MKIQHSDDGKEGAFFILHGGVQVAEMSYVWKGEGKFIIVHTEVSEKLKGQRVGDQLVAASVGFARAKNLKIMPLCPFVKHVFGKTAAYGDVL